MQSNTLGHYTLEIVEKHFTASQYRHDGYLEGRAKSMITFDTLTKCSPDFDLHAHASVLQEGIIIHAMLRDHTPGEVFGTSREERVELSLL